MDNSYLYRVIKKLSGGVKHFKYPIASSMIVGFAAYLFAMANKIINWDETHYLFGKGATISSGRWGLELISWIFPDYSMPWLWGLISILLIAVAICFIIHVFQIRSKLFQCLLAGLIIAFPSEIGTMLYMFTSTSYAVAFLFSIISVWLLRKGGICNYVIAIVLSVFSLSIYQAYIAVTASMLVVLVIQDILNNQTKFSELIKTGIRYVLFLFFALILYAGITYGVLLTVDQELNGWAVRATSDGNGILFRCYRALKLFYAIIFKQTYNLATTDMSILAHIICFGVIAVLVFTQGLKLGDWKKTALLYVLAIAVLPLSVMCLVIMLGENGIHGLTVYSFITVYVFAVIVFEAAKTSREKALGIASDIVVVAMSVIIVSNIYTANKIYLQQYLENRQTYSFYDTVISQIQDTPGFDENCKIMVVGSSNSLEYTLAPFGEPRIYGTNGFRAEGISEYILKYYCGFSVPMANNEERSRVTSTEQFQQMPVYPYEGYVQKIDEFIVVKLDDVQ